MNIFDITRFNARAQENRELKLTNEGLRAQLKGLSAAYEDLSDDNDRLFEQNTEQQNTISLLSEEMADVRTLHREGNVRYLKTIATLKTKNARLLSPSL